MTIALFVAVLAAQTPGTAGSPEPKVFAPGVISAAASELSPAFTPDGNTVFFTRANSSQYVILVSHRKHGRWSTPVVAPFSGVWRDLEATMAPDGSFLIFASNRPAAAGGTALNAFYNGALQQAKGGNLWRVDHTAKGWGAPQRLPDVVNADSSVFSPSIAGDGSLYFMKPDGPHARFHLYRAQYAGGTYQEPVPVPVAVGPDTGDFDPAIAPDESFLVFSSARGKGGLFITFRSGTSWSTPAYMGDEVSQPGGSIEARLSPDHRTLYYSYTRVLPPPPPAQLGGAATDESLRRMLAWNNGLQNIWEVPLDSWLNARP